MHSSFDCCDANMVCNTRIDTQQSMRSLIVCDNFNFNALQYAV